MQEGRLHRCEVHHEKAVRRLMNCQDVFVSLSTGSGRPVRLLQCLRVQHIVVPWCSGPPRKTTFAIVNDMSQYGVIMCHDT